MKIHHRYFGKVAGLLGKMNNEYFDDMTTSENIITSSEDEFVQSWRFDCTDEDKTSVLEDDTLDTNITLHCHNLYKSKNSYFTSCFAVVDPDPFYEICTKMSKTKTSDEISLQKLACISGVSYIEACAFEKIPLRVPDLCIK